MSDKRINILVLGGGGREHALCWKIAQSPLLRKLYCAPINAGIEDIAEIAPCAPENADDVCAFAKAHNIGLVVIGPEAPLVAGVADALAAQDILTFGPSAQAAQLEGSKGFTKDLCAKANIPTAAYARFDNAQAAHDYLAQHKVPIVIKADGLAAGKGVIIAQSDREAHDAVDMIFDGAFGDAGVEIVIEAFMQGEEASFFALCDGTHALPLSTAQDHKRVGEGDTGPNTGGMGAYAPAPLMTAARIDEVMTNIIQPTLKEMAARDMPFKGVLYAGLMLTNEGIKLVEYNVRFGDPECQVIMARLESDIVPALMAVAKGDIRDIRLDWKDDFAVTVVMAAQGYPGAYDKGTRIKNLETLGAQNDIILFHAGTQRHGDHIIATGGRVLNIVACGAKLDDACDKAYKALEQINWSQGFYRKDIGWRAREST